MKKIVFVAALNLLLALPLAGAAFDAAAQNAATQELSTAVLRISEMSTPGCPVLVKAAVRKLNGIVKVETSLEHRTATIEYDPTKSSPAEIQRVIKHKVGFDSKVAQ